MTAEVIEYIRANRNTYTREAINQALLDAGHNAEDIAAAWQVVDGEDDPAQIAAVPRAQSQGQGCLVATWMMAILVGLPLVLLTNVGLGPGYFGAREYAAPESLPILDFALLFVNIGSILVATGLIIATARLLNRRWPVGRVTALVAWTALAWLVIVLGTCLITPQTVR